MLWKNIFIFQRSSLNREKSEMVLIEQATDGYRFDKYRLGGCIFLSTSGVTALIINEHTAT